MPNSNSLAQKMRKTLIGDRAFYKMVFTIIVPIIIQNAITSFVNLLDNVMIGKIGTDQMAGVSIANQIMFVFTLCIFGAVAGAGIFAAQYHGADNPEGVRHCFRFKIYSCLFLSTAAIIVFVLFGSPLISMYLNDAGDPARVAKTLAYGLDYLHVSLWGLPAMAITCAYSSTLREMGKTKLPMIASAAAVITNAVLNCILIYGLLGFPAMGVKGAALATVIARFLELAVISIGTHTRPQQYPFIKGAYASGYVPKNLVRQIFIKGSPLLVNETMWSLGVSIIARCYSLRGLDVVAALNICSTVVNLFNVVLQAMGNATAIIVGQVLGTDDAPRAKDYAWKLIFFGFVCSVATGIVLTCCSPFIPLVYNTSDTIRHLATLLLIVSSICMPIGCFANASYFILRSGGKTIITMLFDCVFTWVMTLPLAYVLAKFTGLGIVTVYLCVQLIDLVKCAVGFYLIRKGVWIHNITVN